MKTETKICAKPLQFSELEHGEWSAEPMGFYVRFDADDPDGERYIASWGEGDSEAFESFDEAKAWCQREADEWAQEIATFAAAPPCPTGDEHAAGRDVVRLCAIPLQFDAGTIYPDDHQEWNESVLGFHISYEPDEPEGERFRAAWGEGESESFGTLEAAQEHCQIEADAWVRKIAHIDQSQETGNG